MQTTRQVILDIPKVILEQFKPFMKPYETKDGLYSDLLNLGLFAFQENESGDKLPLPMFQVPAKSRSESRKMFLVDEQNITKCYPDVPLSTACLNLIFVGVEAYKKALAEELKDKEEQEKKGE